MPGPHPPTANDVIAIVRASEQVAQPGEKRALEAVNLRLAAGKYLVGFRMARDLGVEVTTRARRCGSSSGRRLRTRAASSSLHAT
jgi:hypothetical protein